MNTTLHQNRPEDTQNWTYLFLEPHDYWIHYVTIDLRHQYGISVAESQTFLLVKCPQRRRARRNRCFRRLGVNIKENKVIVLNTVFCQNLRVRTCETTKFLSVDVFEDKNKTSRCLMQHFLGFCSGVITPKTNVYNFRGKQDHFVN